jgi:hypothetical protein
MKYLIISKDFVFIPEICDRFVDEYRLSDLLYREFIESKDIGVITTIDDEQERIYGKDIRCDYYKIVDQEKFFLAKIKYGI